jgi:hypothetical protein
MVKRPIQKVSKNVVIPKYSVFFVLFKRNKIPSIMRKKIHAKSGNSIGMFV